MKVRIHLLNHFYQIINWYYKNLAADLKDGKDMRTNKDIKIQIKDLKVDF